MNKIKIKTYHRLTSAILLVCMALSALLLCACNAQDQATDDGDYVTVIRVIDDIAMGGKFTSDKLETVTVRADSVPEGAYTSEEDLKSKYAADKKGADVFTIVTMKNGFHGRTLTTLAATGQEHYHELFQPLTPGFVHAEPNDLADFERIVAETKVAGVLLECVQGEGGVNVLDVDYVKGVAEICAREDIILMIDEVQTGNGRTGTLYAYMQYGIQPDVVTTAKGLGGGLPIGACLMGEKVEAVLGFGDHGSTFGGNPVCAAGACSILSRIDDALLDDVKKKGEYIRVSLEGAVGVKSVSGLGLMIGIEPENKPAGEIVKKCMQNGVLCLTAKNKVRLLPALNIPMVDLEAAVKVLLAAFAEQ